METDTMTTTAEKALCANNRGTITNTNTHNNASTLVNPSPHSETSVLSSLHDNSSVANYSTASGHYSYATGFQSEATPVMKNTSDSAVPLKPLPPPPPILLGSAGSKQTYSTNQHHRRVSPRGETIPEGDDEDDIHQKNNRKPVCYCLPSFCSGTQGVVVCILIILFFMGLVTMVVSYVLSQQDSSSSDASSSLQDGDASDGLFNSSIFEQPTDNSNNTNSTSTLLPTAMGPAAQQQTPQPATIVPSSQDHEESSLFVDVVEDLLEDAETITLTPSTPTQVPTSSNPEMISVSLSNTRVPTQSPTSVLSTQSPSAILPTESPTVPRLLLDPTTIFTPEEKLVGIEGGDAAGSSTALSGDGQVVIVGSPNASPGGVQRSGRVQIFERQKPATKSKTSFLRQDDATDILEGWEWKLRGIITGSESMNQLGYSVATNRDGSIVVVSQPTADSRTGRVDIYQWQEGESAYVERQILFGEQTTDHFGISLSLSGDGRRLAVGSPYHSTETEPGSAALNLRGQVQVFEYSETLEQWEIMRVEREDLFLGGASLDWMGWSLSLSRDGQILAVGAPRNTEFGGYAQCFQWNGSTWTVMGSPILNAIAPVKLDDRFGHAVSITNTASRPDGTSNNIARVAIGSPWKDMGNVLNSGMVAVYEWNGSSWELDVDDQAWSGVLTEAQPGFYHQLGYAMQMDGDAIVIGVPGHDSRRGLVHLYWKAHVYSESEQGNSWQHLLDPLIGAAPGDDFGFSVGLVTETSGVELNSNPASLSIAVGAIQVSVDSPEATGYSEVFRA